MAYYFEVLPVRQPIEQFQSLVGYTLNLCQQNNIHSRTAFKYMFSISVSRLNNFPYTDYGDLPRTANISHTSFLSLTYQHLLSKFGKSKSIYHMRRFLDISISQYLRFCSRCLALYNCHFLYQQFKCLKYCQEHGTELIDFCPNCRLHKSFFQEPFSLMLCSGCGYDLRNSRPKLASQTEIEVAAALVLNLKHMLQPNIFCESEGFINQLGQTLADYRRYLRISTEDILEQLKVRYSIIQAIESGELGKSNVKFSDYQTYLAAIGLNFHQVFANQT